MKTWPKKRSLAFLNVCSNHYEGYDWDELEAVGVAPYFEALGWNQLSWFSIIDPPRTDFLSFDQLTFDEQDACIQLCFTVCLFIFQLSRPASVSIVSHLFAPPCHP